MIRKGAIKIVDHPGKKKYAENKMYWEHVQP